MANYGNYMSQSPIIHISKNLFSHLYHYFNEAIGFRLIMKIILMVNQNLFTQFLKFFLKFMI
jgi:hypothetical protein